MKRLVWAAEKPSVEAVKMIAIQKRTGIHGSKRRMEENYERRTPLGETGVIHRRCE